jgi:hypothetical protein
VFAGRSQQYQKRGGNTDSRPPQNLCHSHKASNENAAAFINTLVYHNTGCFVEPE